MLSQIKAYYKSLIPKMTEEEWEFIASMMKVVNIHKGDFIIKEGQVCNQVSYINSGLVRIYNIVDGRENIQGFAIENEYIAEYASFLTRRPSILFMDMIEDGQLINLTYDNIQKSYEQVPSFERLGRKIAEQLFIEFNDHNVVLHSLTPEQRYMALIDKESQLLKRIPQYMLASYLGITPEHLSRIRKKITIKVP
jgi:CRP/FNR family transcriptional regulator, anaerobic regulatory protein